MQKNMIVSFKSLTMLYVLPCSYCHNHNHIIVVYNSNVKLCTLEIDKHELHILLIYWPIYAKFCENIKANK